MDDVIRFGAQEDLLARDRIEIELPRFLVRALEEQVAKVTASGQKKSGVSLNDYLELHLAKPTSSATSPESAQPSGLDGGDPRERVAAAGIYRARIRPPLLQADRAFLAPSLDRELYFLPHSRQPPHSGRPKPDERSR